jgi:hypothetical protein
MPGHDGPTGPITKYFFTTTIGVVVTVIYLKYREITGGI